LNEAESECHIETLKTVTIEVVEESEKNGRLHLSDNLHLGYDVNDDSDQVLGIRFTLEVPHVAKINTARITFNASLSADVPLYLKIQAEKKSDTQSFISVDYVGTRPVFSNKVNWSINTPWRVNDEVSTPDISSLLQSIVNQDTWEADNTIGIIIRGIQPQDQNFRTVSSAFNTIILSVQYCTLD